jgi:hypothetical protein
VTRLVRLGAALLGIVNLGWGAWAVLSPAGFYGTFPGFGRRWTSAYPPYNEHLVTDLGGTFLTLGALLAAAALLGDRRVTTVVLAGDLLWNSLHLAYHARHRGIMSGGDYLASLLALGIGVVGPAVLLALHARAARARARG